MAKYVKLTINSNWGGVAPQTGLSEVRFFYVPVQARAAAAGRRRDGRRASTPTLNWRPGREATSHKVYLGTDQNAVADGTAPAKTVTEHSFDPGSLNFGTTYFWKVDEVGDAGTYAGDVWSFTTQEYAADRRLRELQRRRQPHLRYLDRRLDRHRPAARRSATMPSPFAEKTIVHGGKQSMPLTYDNSASPFCLGGRADLRLRRRTGPPTGPTPCRCTSAGQLPAFVETASGSILMNAIGTDIWNTADQFRFAYKTLTGNGTMVARVESIFNSNVWAKGGVMIRQSIEPGSTHAFMPITPAAAAPATAPASSAG